MENAQPGATKTRLFRHTSLLPEDQRLCEIEESLSQGHLDKPAAGRAVNYDHYDREWWSQGFRRVFTDGSRVYPQDHRISRGGFAVFYGIDHPWNLACKLEGYDLTPYRAELRACLHVVEHADVYTWITLDNEAVVNTAHFFQKTKYRPR